MGGYLPVIIRIRDHLVHSIVISIHSDVAIGHGACNPGRIISKTAMGPTLIVGGHWTQQEVCLMWCHPGQLPGICLTSSHVSIMRFNVVNQVNWERGAHYEVGPSRGAGPPQR